MRLVGVAAGSGDFSQRLSPGGNHSSGPVEPDHSRRFLGADAELGRELPVEVAPAPPHLLGDAGHKNTAAIPHEMSPRLDQLRPRLNRAEPGRGSALHLGEGPEKNLIDGVEPGGPCRYGIHPFIQLGGDRPGDLLEVVGAVSEVAGRDAEDRPRRERSEVDLDSGHRPGMTDQRRAQVQARQENVEGLGGIAGLIVLVQRFADRDDEGQRARGQSQMRPRGDVGDVVADVVPDELAQARMWMAGEIIDGVRRHIRSVDPPAPGAF